MRRPIAWALAFAVAFAALAFTQPPAGAAGKSLKECSAERAACRKLCDKLVDLDDNIKRCRDRCTDKYLLCQLPSAPSGFIDGGDSTPPVEPRAPLGQAPAGGILEVPGAQ